EALRNVFPSLGRVRSIGDIKERIAELARGKRPGEWIVTMPIGDPPYYFDVPDILAERRWPTRHDLDAAAPNNPVYIRSIWGFWPEPLRLVPGPNPGAFGVAGTPRARVPRSEPFVMKRAQGAVPTAVFTGQGRQPTPGLIGFGAGPASLMPTACARCPNRRAS